MDNTIQLYIDDEKKTKGYPITSPDRVVDEKGKSVQEEITIINGQLDNIVCFKKGILTNSSKDEIFFNENLLLSSFSNRNSLSLKSNNKKISSNNTSCVFTGEYLKFENITFVEMEALSIDGSKLVEIKNCTFTNQYRWGVLASNIDTIVIDNCRFENIGLKTDLRNSNEGMGLFFNTIKNVIVRNCTFTTCRGQSAIRFRDVTNLDVHDNKFYKNWYRAIEFNSLTPLERLHVHGKIHHNTIIDCGIGNPNLEKDKTDERTNGIYAGCWVYDVDIQNNIIVNCLENAIEGKFGDVSNNYIDTTGAGKYPTSACVGISASCKAIRHNTIRNTLRAGIGAGGSCETVNHAIIENNYFDNCKEGGIQFNFTDTPNLQHVQIINNVNKTGGKVLEIINSRHSMDILDNSIEKWYIGGNKGGQNVLPPSNKINLIGDYHELITNGNFFKWESNNSSPSNFIISQNPTIQKSVNTDTNEVLLQINKATNTPHLIQKVNRKIENNLFEFRCVYRATSIRLLIRKLNADGTLTNIYDITDTNSSSDYKVFKHSFSMWKMPDTENFECVLVLVSDETIIKNISLKNFY